MRRERGFTVVELLIVVSIIAILASLAVPGYYRMVEAAHRAEAQGLLGELYGMENAFFAEQKRFGCLDEVGFQIEGKGHFAVWICDDGAGCFLTPDGGVRCPCFEAPDDWTGAGGDPFVKNDTDPGVRFAWAPIPRGAGGRFLAAGPPVWTTIPVFSDLAVPDVVDGGQVWLPPPPPENGDDLDLAPQSGSLPVPIDLPDDCAAVMRRAIFTAGADNWCRRSIPETVDVFWVLSDEGKRINGESYPEPTGDMSQCTTEPPPPPP